MTLVEIYLAQGYRRKALAALREMAVAEPGRADLTERITEMQEIVASEDRDRGVGLDPEAPESGPALMERHDSTHLDRMRLLSSRRRAADKEQFQTWINGLRERTEPQH